MNKIAKTLILTAAAAALSLSAVSEASADSWRRHHNNDAVSYTHLTLPTIYSV